MVLHPRLRDMNIEGDLYGLFAGLALSFIMILMRMLKDEPWQKIVLFYSGASVILGGILMIPSFKMPQGAQWGYLLVMGICMYSVQYLITIALHFAKASTLSPLIYSSIIFSGIIGWVVWHHIPSPISLAGMLVIIISGILVLMFESDEAEEVEEEMV
jgi:drug/metabolite transporter (DMT)-like permease